MANVRSFVFIILQYYLLQFFSINCWKTPFVKNSKTMPSVKVVLEPPEDPLPQVSGSIQALERNRLKTEESLMSRLEDVYNKVLDESQESIEKTLKEALTIFEDKKFLETVIKGSLQQANLKRKQNRHFSGFKQEGETGIFGKKDAKKNVKKAGDQLFVNSSTINETFLAKNVQTKIMSYSLPNTHLPMQQHDSVKYNKSIRDKQFSKLNCKKNNQPFHEGHFSNGPMNSFSFLQVSEKFYSSLTSLNKVGSKGLLKLSEKFPGKNMATNVLKKLQNSAAPSVSVEVVDLFEPDAKIENKMKEMEQKRNDEEGKMFEQAADELKLLTTLMAEELKKNIQIQMNVFLVDAKSIQGTLSSSLSKFLPNLSSKKIKFKQIYQHPFGQSSIKKKNYKDCLALKKKFKLTRLNCEPSKKTKRNTFSFVQVKNTMTLSDSNAPINPDQLNVKIGASDKAYPTVDQLVDNMEKRRDATERLERAKILELHINLMRAQIEMIKDALHTHLARILALYGSMTDAIKEETLLASIH